MTNARPKFRAFRPLFPVTSYVLAFIAGGAALLLFFDLALPHVGTHWFGLMLPSWPLLPVAAMLAAFLYFISKLAERMHIRQRTASVLRGIAITLGVLAGGPILLLIVDAEIYRPIKFSLLIRQVESAQTVNAEFRAFRLAERWGYVFELNRHWRRDYLPPRAQLLPGDWILELEWLECSPSGTPYRAYRRVLDERNLSVFRKRTRANHPVQRTGASRITHNADPESSAAGPSR